MAETTDVSWDAERAGAVDQLRSLANEAVAHGRDLLQAELSLAKLELKGELRKLAVAAVLGGFALVLFHAGFLVLVAAIILALFGEPLAAAIAGGVLILLAVGAALAAYAAFKRRHLARTRAALSRDVAVLRLRHE